MTAELSHRPPDALFELVTDQWTEPFWAAARERRLVVARCADCGFHRMPPTPFCPQCWSKELKWTEVSGRMELYSFTVVRKANLPEIVDSLPYVPCVVELEQPKGIRLISNVVDTPLDRIRIGSALSLVWHERRDGVTLPYFRCTNECKRVGVPT